MAKGAARGGSGLSKTLAQPVAAASKRPAAKAAELKQQPFPLAPAAPAQPAQVARFNFDSPSPDDIVQAAHQGRPMAQSAALGAAPTISATPPAGGGGVQGTADRLGQLSVTGSERSAPPAAAATATASSSSSSSSAAKRPGARLAVEYVMEPELRRACDAAAAGDAGSGGKAKLHLVVLGHVDAGKSTLMGRFLYELGLVAEKRVHKIQV